MQISTLAIQDREKTFCVRKIVYQRYLSLSLILGPSCRAPISSRKLYRLAAFEPTDVELGLKKEPEESDLGVKKEEPVDIDMEDLNKPSSSEAVKAEAKDERLKERRGTTSLIHAGKCYAFKNERAIIQV